MSAALATLFYPLETGLLTPGRVLFLNAQHYPFLDQLDKNDLCLQQFFKPYEAALGAKGYDASPSIPCEHAAFDMVMLAAPKNQIETLYLMAQGLQALKPGGVLVVAAENKAGGGRLVKNFGHFGLGDIQNETRNKARVVWAENNALNDEALKRAIKDGSPQSVCEEEFYSCPGIYGWNKIDKGSALLVQHLPDDLSGNGADFGCGYGYLGTYILQRENVKALHNLDADWRALEMCRKNLAGIKSEAFVEFAWEDLTQRTMLQALDFIVMNPPFHEGKSTDILIGEGFIASAAHSLKRGGRLFMVANKHLPYEQVLQQNFSDVQKPCEGQGFKVFCAIK